MEAQIVGYIPKILYKLYLFLQNKFDPKPAETDEERFAIQICNKIIDFPSSKLTYAPISNKRFIKNEEKDMFIILEGNTIFLINHIYSYNVYVQDSSQYFKLTKKFDNILEKERMLLENEIRSNIQHSLSIILEKVS